MDRLLDFTNGSLENLRELVTLYLNQTSEQLKQLATAIAANAAPEVRRLAHSCAGASATCGMRRLAPQLRELERQGMEGKLTNADRLCQEVTREFDRIRAYLEDYLARRATLATSS